jgi:hypothetical protein
VSIQGGSILYAYDADASDYVSMYHTGTYGQFESTKGFVLVSNGEYSTTVTGTHNPQFQVQNSDPEGSWSALKFYHDNTDGFISTSAGSVKIQPNNNNTHITGNATTTGSMDAATFCISGANCITSWPSAGAGGSNWNYFNATTIKPTSTVGLFVSASSTINANFRVDGNATTTKSMDATEFCLAGANCIDAWSDVSVLASWDTLLSKPATSTILNLLDTQYRIANVYATSSVIDNLRSVNATSTSMDATSYCIAGANCITAWTYFVQDGCTDCLNATEIEDIYLFDDGDVGTGVYDFGGATTFEIPNAAAVTGFGAIGQIGLDTTTGQLKLATSTTNGVGAVYALPTKEKMFIVPSTTDDWYFKKMTEIPPMPYGINMTGIMCYATGTAASRFNLTFSDGTNNVTTIGCGTTRPTAATSTTANTGFTAGEKMIASYTGKEGTVDNAYITFIYTITAD